MGDVDSDEGVELDEPATLDAVSVPALRRRGALLSSASADEPAPGLRVAPDGKAYLPPCVLAESSLSDSPVPRTPSVAPTSNVALTADAKACAKSPSKSEPLRAGSVALPLRLLRLRVEDALFCDDPESLLRGGICRYGCLRPEAAREAAKLVSSLCASRLPGLAGGTGVGAARTAGAMMANADYASGCVQS